MKRNPAHSIAAIAAFFLMQAAAAQFKDPSYSLSLDPTLGQRMIVYKGNFSSSYKDSLSKADRSRDALGFSFLYSFRSGKNRRLSTGLQLHNTGFSRRKENIRFLDTIHPEIGLMNDLSQTGGAYVDFNYRFMYLSIPLLYTVQLSGKKLKNTRIHAMYGASVSVLMKHDIRAVLHGFSTRGGEKVHILNNSAAEAERFNASLQGGFRVETPVEGKEFWAFVQPVLWLPALASNRGSERYRLWAFSVQIGIAYQPSSDQKKSSL